VESSGEGVECGGRVVGEAAEGPDLAGGAEGRAAVIGVVQRAGLGERAQEVREAGPGGLVGAGVDESQQLTVRRAERGVAGGQVPQHRGQVR
jgi:hypothetical protein